MTNQTNDNALATIEQIEIQLANMTDFDIDLIGAQLGALYSDAEGRGDMVAAGRAGWLWDMAQQQHAALATASNIAHTAAGLAKTHAIQRDAALKEYQDLADAIDTADYDNEKVASLIEMVEEDSFNAAVDSFEICTNEPGVLMCDGVFRDLLPRVTRQDDPQLNINNQTLGACEDFADLLFHTQPSDCSQELRRRVLDFIKDVQPLIQQERVAAMQRQHAAFDEKMAAIRAQWKAQQDLLTSDDEDLTDIDEYEGDDDDFDVDA